MNTQDEALIAYRAARIQCGNHLIESGKNLTERKFYLVPVGIRKAREALGNVPQPRNPVHQEAYDALKDFVDTRVSELNSGLEEA